MVKKSEEDKQPSIDEIQHAILTLSSRKELCRVVVAVQQRRNMLDEQAILMFNEGDHVSFIGRNSVRLYGYVKGLKDSHKKTIPVTVGSQRWKVSVGRLTKEQHPLDRAEGDDK